MKRDDMIKIIAYYLADYAGVESSDSLYEGLLKK